MATVFANGRSILHAGDGNKHVAAPPDVCKTPSPGGPVPIPYVNVASDGDLASGTKAIKIEGKAAAKADSNLSTSMGDEAGTAGGGIVSSKTKGKLTWGTSSGDVKLEGKGAVRFMDVTQHNGNSFNSAFTALGAGGLAYLDDFKGVCDVCGKGPDEHRVLATGELAEKTTKLVQELSKLFDAAADDDARARVARTYDNGQSWSGYMVGVMSCKCDPPQYFATNSGETMPGLHDAAGTVGGITVIGGGAATKQDFTNANKAKVPRGKKVEAIQKAFSSANTKMSAGVSGYNRAGNCAGAKLVAKAKHAPMYMCEIYFAPNDWSAIYKVLTTTAEKAAAGGDDPAWKQAILANEHAEPEERQFKEDEPVPSCHTCQDTLFLTNCPERKC
jgi:hypothetical protein